ncbi:triose-phosphate isomerase [Deferribacter desulfuricans SSM1]|uniref:Triosephosphate isomerase n=1 Tax=Deferribacter desulfuricans (strain DSM 14783 / JCM 11476 / NBRC 101012 / SSM1) TaxID=639282 RepID=D3PAL8_DEFDS|nr:triose-phosphate isomerase [Deferribacter desulfuricans]BAI79641.1 triose-phosphate isomerase [Deferribacter desulfuricans SSM1]
MRKPLIVGNWKMNTTISEGVELVKSVIDSGVDQLSVDFGFAPPFISIYEIKKYLNDSHILAGQNMYFEDSGAYTGEISADMLLGAGCNYVILGHSERRHIFGETDEVINKKVLHALKKGLNVILCVGELLEEREAGCEVETVLRQVGLGLKSVEKGLINNVVIAYEPVWAIGTGKTASKDDAEKMHMEIRKYIAKLYDDDVAQRIRIMYGGSVKPENIKELMSSPEIDGALVGGASLKAESFIKILKYYE